MFRRCSHKSFPVSAFRHITRSCIDSPSPDVLNRKMRPPITIGVERPPYGAFQTRFSPFGDQRVGRPFSSDAPLRAGPRQSGQSLADLTRSGGAGGIKEADSRANRVYVDRMAFMIGLH